MKIFITRIIYQYFTQSLTFISSRKKKFTLLHLFQIVKKNFTTMYSRNKKDSYRKRIEELIGGQKRSRKSSVSSEHSRKSSVNSINFDDNSNDDSSNNGTNNNEASGSSNINDLNTITSGSSNINDFTITSGSNDFNTITSGSSGNKNQLKRWIPRDSKIEGIRKYSRANIINL